MRCSVVPDEPLRVLWEYSFSEAAGAMSTELMALGNHRPALRAEIGEGTERIRKAQLEALKAKYGDDVFLDDRFSPEAMVLLLTSIPKYLSLEDGINVDMAHRELVRPSRAISNLSSRRPGPVRASLPHVAAADPAHSGPGTRLTAPL